MYKKNSLKTEFSSSINWHGSKGTEEDVNSTRGFTHTLSLASLQLFFNN